MSVADRIKAKLTAALAPSRLVVTDESSLHEGHSGWREGGETHFHVEIVSAAFQGMARVQCHRRIYELLDEEIREGIHALRLTTSAD